MNILIPDWSKHILCDLCCCSFPLNTYTGDLNEWNLLRLASILVLMILDIGELL